MNYTENYSRLSSELFRKTESGIRPQLKNIQMLQGDFHSDYSILLHSRTSSSEYVFGDSDSNREINTHFSFPVIRPAGRKALTNAIILLHGLNERSWDKYLPWAFSLAQQTGKSVILFPIAYHMNRSPEAWRNPRTMSPYVDLRAKNITDIHDSTVLNVALSERISRQPERFFLSGYQAAQDIIRLVDDLKAGRNSLFEPDTRVDFFAYSIGVLLSEVLLFANPEGRFSHSRFFFFCGGSVLEGMRGESRYILDNQAFGRLTAFYNRDLVQESEKTSLFSDLLSQTLLGQTFLKMISFSHLDKYRKKIIRRIQDQVQTICLTRDHVMPAESIKRTLKGTPVFELDFPYAYTHEIPFPLRANHMDTVIDQSFAQVFRPAGSFLSS